MHRLSDGKGRRRLAYHLLRGGGGARNIPTRWLMGHCVETFHLRHNANAVSCSAKYRAIAIFQRPAAIILSKSKPRLLAVRRGMAFRKSPAREAE